jgi:hypothetical protein
MLGIRVSGAVRSGASPHDGAGDHNQIEIIGCAWADLGESILTGKKRESLP